MAGIWDIAAGNARPEPGFAKRPNARFAKAPARRDDLHRPLNTEPDRLREIGVPARARLTLPGTSWCATTAGASCSRRTISPATCRTAHVDTYEFPDGRLQIRAKGMATPFTAFDPDQQRVSQAVITENKHRTAALAHIKAKQDARPADAPRARVRPSSAKNG